MEICDIRCMLCLVAVTVVSQVNRLGGVTAKTEQKQRQEMNSKYCPSNFSAVPADCGGIILDLAMKRWTTCLTNTPWSL
ncbi:hypothetical protein EV421DRAFT_1843137, partial [Armillaria borealis]